MGKGLTKPRNECGKAADQVEKRAKTILESQQTYPNTRQSHYLSNESSRQDDLCPIPKNGLTNRLRGN